MKSVLKYRKIYEGKIVFVFSKGPRGRILDCQLATVKKIHTGGDVELWDGRIFEQRIDDYKGLEYRYRSRKYYWSTLRAPFTYEDVSDFRRIRNMCPF